MIGEDKTAALDCIRRAQAGDVDAFETLYRDHVGRIYALCLRLKAGDNTDATELMQDVFVRAWRRLGTFRGDCAFSSWLHRLAVNTMLENARGDRRREARVLAMDDTSRLPGAARSSGVELKMDMEEAVASRLDTIGVPREARPFSPHLTLARVRDPTGLQGVRFLQDLAPPPHTAGMVDAITLFESRLSPGGPIYTVLQRTTLREG
jgi:RNA polymerase sigma factor (sigma-70 family)